MTQLETPDGNDPIAVYACRGRTNTTRLKAAGYTAKEILPNTHVQAREALPATHSSDQEK
jgi:hypothetical protein